MCQNIAAMSNDVFLIETTGAMITRCYSEGMTTNQRNSSSPGTLSKSEQRKFCIAATAGEYLAMYEGEPAADPGSRCGYSDLELHEMKEMLSDRRLILIADDIGLVVANEERVRHEEN